MSVSLLIKPFIFHDRKRSCFLVASYPDSVPPAAPPGEDLLPRGSSGGTGPGGGRSAV